MDLVTDLPSEPWCTPEEFARFIESHDDEPNRYELLNGRIVMTPPPGWAHSETSIDIGSILRAFVKAHNLGFVLGEADLLLPSADWVRSDITFFSHQRAAACVRKPSHTEGVPDLVVEVLSRWTASRDRGEKKAMYQSNGVREYWLADDVTHSITRFDLVDGRFGPPNVFGREGELISIILPGLSVPIGDVYPDRPWSP